MARGKRRERVPMSPHKDIGAGAISRAKSVTVRGKVAAEISSVVPNPTPAVAPASVARTWASTCLTNCNRLARYLTC